jgi:pimeloyl-ACP methyl ester carboxylesterase
MQAVEQGRMNPQSIRENQPSVPDRYTTDSVTSKDGTPIGYRQYGRGSSGIVLVQGAMGLAENYSTLAEALSDVFAVFVPDRRGRGLSPLPYRKDHTIQRDVEDLEALLRKTATHNVFALSSGAVIALTAAARGSAIHKLAVFEPPLYEGRALPTGLLARFDRSIAKDDLADSLTVAGKAVVPMLKYVPYWLLNFFTNRILSREAKQPRGNEPTLREITLSLQYDFQVIAEMHGALSQWNAIKAEVLLLGGGKSLAYLKTDLDALQKVLPHARRLTFAGLGHSASWNHDAKRNRAGDPESVAFELRRFFS